MIIDGVKTEFMMYVLRRNIKANDKSGLIKHKRVNIRMLRRLRLKDIYLLPMSQEIL